MACLSASLTLDFPAPPIGRVFVILIFQCRVFPISKVVFCISQVIFCISKVVLYISKVVSLWLPFSYPPPH